MSTYKSFAIAGAGNLGRPIVKVFSDAGTPLIVLTRAEGGSLPADLTSLPHVTSKPVDYNSEASIASALAGVDVVISALSGVGFGAQPALARAAKEAGVKLFVPSEFGIPTAGWTPDNAPVLYTKVKAQQMLKEIGLPYLLVHNGGFSDWIPFMTGYQPTGGKKFVVVGKGDTTGSWTSLNDIGRFLQHVLTTLPPQDLEWRTLRIEGDRKSLNQITAVVAKKAGKDVPTDYVDYAETKANSLKAGPAGFRDWLGAIVEEGKMSVLWDETAQKYVDKNDNGLFPQWNPKGVDEVVNELPL